MEIDYSLNLEMDRDADALAESTLSNSLVSSITVENSRGDADSNLDECSGWTNEKHNSYLDYLENSFVRQLYSLLGRETQRLSRNSYRSTDQFTVRQKGCWQKVNYVKKQARLEKLSEYRFLKKSSRSNTENPSKNHTMETVVQGNVLYNEETKHSSEKTLTRTYFRNSEGQEHPVQSTAETSGQNFSEEEEEEKRWDSVSEVNRKRGREENNEDSSLNDQVVPARTVKPRM